MTTNSVIFKNPEDDHLIDLTYLGIMLRENTTVQITQENHFFMIGDVLAYSPSEKAFIRAIAINTMDSEICGLVSEVIDNDNFIIVCKGQINAPQYQYPNGSTLWLSEVNPGKLMSIKPTKTFRQVGTQVSPGVINVDLQMGLTMGGSSPSGEPLERYTKDELDEIIANINSM